MDRRRPKSSIQNLTERVSKPSIFHNRIGDSTIKRDRNWLEFLAVIDGVFASLLSSSNGTSSPGETERAACLPLITSAREFFTNIAQQDGKKDRSGFLALLELEKRARSYSLSTGTLSKNTLNFSHDIYGIIGDSSTLEKLLTAYFSEFGEKACCFEDLKPYISLEGNDLATWTSYLENLPISTVCSTLLPHVHTYFL
jgi:N-terminal acetyltransferase B complex non-catalytic subunit